MDDQSKYFGDDCNQTPTKIKVINWEQDWKTDQYFEGNNENAQSANAPMVGDNVDAIKIEFDIPGNISIWEEAQIVQDTGVSYKVVFEREDPRFTREIDKEFWEESIAPRGTHTKNSEWRYELQNKVGSYVDFYQVGFGWWEARITASMMSLDCLVDQVLLQITRVPPGKSKTLSSFKEVEFPQVSIRSPLIRKHKEKFWKPNEEIELEEMNKSTFKPSGPWSVWVKKGGKTTVQTKITEYFWEIGCHFDINNRIKDIENPPRVWLVIQLLNYLSIASKHISKDKDETFTPDFERSIRIYFGNGGVNKSIKEFK